MSADHQVVQLQKRIEELENQTHLLPEKVDYLTHKLFGRSSEQTSSLNIEVSHSGHLRRLQPKVRRKELCQSRQEERKRCF